MLAAVDVVAAKLIAYTFVLRAVEMAAEYVAVFDRYVLALAVV